MFSGWGKGVFQIPRAMFYIISNHPELVAKKTAFEPFRAFERGWRFNEHGLAARKTAFEPFRAFEGMAF